MSQLTINIDPVALREATSQAIMGILTPEMRDKLIRDSISNLLNPSTNSWDKNQSPIQLAFNNAVVAVAHQVCLEHVKNDPNIRVKLVQMARDVADKVFNKDLDAMADKVAQAFVESIRSDRS